LLINHYKYTASPLAKNIYDNLKREIKYFVKVMPGEYKRILREQGVAKKLDLGEYSDG
jgi:glutamate synthase (NADPH/NADH) large chain